MVTSCTYNPPFTVHTPLLIATHEPPRFLQAGFVGPWVKAAFEGSLGSVSLGLRAEGALDVELLSVGL